MPAKNAGKMETISRWRQSLWKFALLTDRTKAFDCLDHELLIAKLNAYGFSLPALRLINDYSLVGDNELELEIRLVISLKLYLEYPKGQY